MLPTPTLILLRAHMLPGDERVGLFLRQRGEAQAHCVPLQTRLFAHDDMPSPFEGLRPVFARVVWGALLRSGSYGTEDVGPGEHVHDALVELARPRSEPPLVHRDLSALGEAS
jgi:hypothetical protein